jgi:hypothetical protein
MGKTDHSKTDSTLSSSSLPLLGHNMAATTAVHGGTRWRFAGPPRGNSRDQVTCSICNEAQDDTTVELDCPFRHRFHQNCVEAWFLGNYLYSCPMCGHRVSSDVDDDEMVLFERFRLAVAQNDFDRIVPPGWSDTLSIIVRTILVNREIPRFMRGFVLFLYSVNTMILLKLFVVAYFLFYMTDVPSRFVAPNPAIGSRLRTALGASEAAPESLFLSYLGVISLLVLGSMYHTSVASVDQLERVWAHLLDVDRRLLLAQRGDFPADARQIIEVTRARAPANREALMLANVRDESRDSSLRSEVRNLAAANRGIHEDFRDWLVPARRQRFIWPPPPSERPPTFNGSHGGGRRRRSRRHRSRRRSQARLPTRKNKKRII